jgi:hypothetical protein
LAKLAIPVVLRVSGVGEVTGTSPSGVDYPDQFDIERRNYASFDPANAPQSSD